MLQLDLNGWKSNTNVRPQIAILKGYNFNSLVDKNTPAVFHDAITALHEDFNVLVPSDITSIEKEDALMANDLYRMACLMSGFSKVLGIQRKQAIKEAGPITETLLNNIQKELTPFSQKYATINEPFQQVLQFIIVFSLQLKDIKQSLQNEGLLECHHLLHMQCMLDELLQTLNMRIAVSLTPSLDPVEAQKRNSIQEKITQLIKPLNFKDALENPVRRSYRQQVISLFTSTHLPVSESGCASGNDNSTVRRSRTVSEAEAFDGSRRRIASGGWNNTLLQERSRSVGDISLATNGAPPLPLDTLVKPVHCHPVVVAVVVPLSAPPSTPSAGGPPPSSAEPLKPPKAAVCCTVM